MLALIAMLGTVLAQAIDYVHPTRTYRTGNQCCISIDRTRLAIVDQTIARDAGVIVGIVPGWAMRTVVGRAQTFTGAFDAAQAAREVCIHVVILRAYSAGQLLEAKLAVRWAWRANLYPISKNISTHAQLTSVLVFAGYTGLHLDLAVYALVLPAHEEAHPTAQAHVIKSAGRAQRWAHYALVGQCVEHVPDQALGALIYIVIAQRAAQLMT